MGSNCVYVLKCSWQVLEGYEVVKAIESIGTSAELIWHVPNAEGQRGQVAAVDIDTVDSGLYSSYRPCPARRVVNQ